MHSSDGYFREVGKIVNSFIGFEDHGILTVSLTIDFGTSVQSSGTYNLGPANGNAASKFIAGILNACGVSDWEKIKGSIVNVIYTSEPSLTALPVGIESLPFNNGSTFVFMEAFSESD